MVPFYIGTFTNIDKSRSRVSSIKHNIIKYETSKGEENASKTTKMKGKYER